MVTAVRPLGQRLRLHGEALEGWSMQGGQRAEDPTALLHAAKQVEDAAEAVAEDRRRCDDTVRDPLLSADRALSAVPIPGRVPHDPCP